MNNFYRNIFKYNGILITFWSKNKDISKKSKFLIMAYGCPSHPFDHNPSTLKQLLKENLILVYFDYIGTFGSDGICTFDNSLDSIFEVIVFLKKGNYCNIRTNKKIIWNLEEIILIGASYGGSLVLCAGALDDNINKIISCSPVINWEDFDKENLKGMYNFLKYVYNNFWRADHKSLEKLRNGDILISPKKYINGLKNKKILIIQDKSDYQIPFKDVELFFQDIKSNEKKLYFENKNRHILLNNICEENIYKEIKKIIY